jgi:Plavaka transposase
VSLVSEDTGRYQKFVQWFENWFGGHKIGFVGPFPKVGVVTMGYSNKRRRSKRKRTRILNALQNIRNPHHNPFSSDDESSVDFLQQNSSSPSFCSSHSHHSSFMAYDNHLIPNSIFLDDINIPNSRDHGNNEFPVDDNNEDDLSSVIDIHNINELMNHYQETPHDAEDDVTLHSSASSFEENNIHNENPIPCFVHDQHHRFDEMTHNETASFKIMSLLDTAGAPRICYDRLLALLKKLLKEGIDLSKAINRETLMQRLATKYKACPRIEMSTVNKQEVFRFMFQDMLQDLLHSSSKHLHIITPIPLQDNLETGAEHELWNTRWMHNTFATDHYRDFDIKNDIMLPIILYMDKTGTDVNQRYSLEPVLFSLAALPREQRESRHSWRHLGFVPQKHNSLEDESSSSLQFYHDCLSYLIDGLREAQKNPPTVSIRLPDGIVVQRRALLPLMVVMGDQLSQDTLCGRLKSNSGGAGRVHRSCMCSYLHIDDPYHECKRVNAATLHLLTTYATMSDEDMDNKISSHPTFSRNTKEGRTMKSFFQRQRTMFRGILRHPFTTHPIKSAFTDIDFGSWTAGIHDATFDDFMHSVEAGMVAYITETVYDGLTKKEKEIIEETTRPMLDNQRCSVISTYPRWRLQSGFTRQTLMTSGERVGSVLALSLSLQDPTIRETIRQGHCRQIQKYLDLSTDSICDKTKTEEDPKADNTMKKIPPPPPPEFYLAQHMHRLDDQSIRHTLEHL